MKSEILQILRARSEYVSGQELCTQLGVTRAAIWKAVRQLKEEGYEIQAVRNKGYRLVASPDTMGRAELQSRMRTSWAGKQVVFLDSVDSTNNYAKKLAEAGAAHGTLVVAESQDGGRGRSGRAWVTPKGSSIAASLIVRPPIRPEHASMLTLVMGVAVARAIADTTGVRVQIKWPNDLVVGGKKISGTLTEMSAEPERVHYVVIGTGINANVTEFPRELRQTATSLQLETGHPVERGAVLCACMGAFEEAYAKFLEKGDLSLLLEEYQGLLANRGREVRVLDPAGAFCGMARGIDSMGRLIVEKEDGQVAHIYAGEVSVRGIDQYV